MPQRERWCQKNGGQSEDGWALAVPENGQWVVVVLSLRTVEALPALRQAAAAVRL
ncbi:MAG: hypothetical protein OWU33_16735 [Firmicutes bacterium]|nr:hypothetical protein [Bacillota bacterium]